jgi:AcrR family transcriptional regulator
MPAPRTAVTKSKRKQPRQARSRQLRADLLEGATRVLASDGAQKFTTNRVAEATGVSIGSLYQYYPNKQSLLLELHDRDAADSWRTLAQLLRDTTRSPRERFQGVICGSFEAQVAAHEHHSALRAGPAVTDSTGFADFAQTVIADLTQFLREVLPSREGEAEFLARFCFTIVGGALEQVANGQINPEETTRLAAEMTTMLTAHLGLP